MLLIYSFVSGMDYKPMISSIEFRGNDKTKDYIIEREIQHQINTVLDSSLAAQACFQVETRCCQQVLLFGIASGQVDLEHGAGEFPG